MKFESQKKQGDIAVFYRRLYMLRPHAYVTVILVTANVILFLLSYYYEQLNVFSPGNTSALLKWGAGYGLLTTNGQWWRLISAAFVHFGIIHLTLNMIFLYFAGSLVERFYTSRLFFIIYFFSAFTGNLTSLFIKGGAYIGGGASGAVFGVIGALAAVLLVQHKNVPISVLKPLRSIAVSFIVYNLFIGFAIPQIDNAAHIGGLIGGFISGLLLSMKIEEASGRQILGKLIVTACVISSIITAVWEPVIGNTRKDALCRNTVKNIKSAEVLFLNRVTMELNKPVKTQFDLFVKATRLDELAEFWAQYLENLDDVNRPVWPLHINEYELYYNYCQARVKLLSCISRGFRVGMTKEHIDNTAKLTQAVQRIQQQIRDNE